jgi:hypothetical protein
MSDIRLDEIVIDPTIQVREVEAHTVSKYAASMRSGETFPALLVEKGTNRLVCGNHRYFAYKRVLEPSDKVSCEFREFADEADIIRVAARDNATHGRPLDTWDLKRITLKLQRLGDSSEAIAQLLGVPVSKVETWSGMKVVVIGKQGRRVMKHEEPLKHGLEHLAGKEIPEDQWTEHVQRDRGVPARQQAMTLTRWISNGWIDESDTRTLEALEELHDSLTTLLERVIMEEDNE